MRSQFGIEILLPIQLRAILLQQLRPRILTCDHRRFRSECWMLRQLKLHIFVAAEHTDGPRRPLHVPMVALSIGTVLEQSDLVLYIQRRSVTVGLQIRRLTFLLHRPLPVGLHDVSPGLHLRLFLVSLLLLCSLSSSSLFDLYLGENRPHRR